MGKSATRSSRAAAPATDLPGQQRLPLDEGQDPADRLRFECRGIRVSFREMGREKQLSDEHKSEIAETLDADERSLRLGKRILDAKEDKVKKVSAAKSAIEGYWKGLTLDYPESGLRLIRESDIESFVTHIDQLIANFMSAVDELDRDLPNIINRERQRLGRAFNAADYPSSVRGLYGVRYEFTNVEPPEYLLKLNPALYEREAERVRQRFQVAANMAEEALAVEMNRVLEQLITSLQNVTAGTQKSFKDSTVDGLFAVFDEFRDKLGHFGIGRGSKLDEAITAAQRVITGHDRELLPNSLRKSTDFRARVVEGMTEVQNTLAAAIEQQPRARRRLLLD